MRRLMIAMFVVAFVQVGSATATATTPPSPPRTTVARTRPTTADSEPLTTDRPGAPVTTDADDWTLARIVVTGAAAIGGLAFVGWAVARVRNELAKPSVPKP